MNQNRNHDVTIKKLDSFRKRIISYILENTDENFFGIVSAIAEYKADDNDYFPSLTVLVNAVNEVIKLSTPHENISILLSLVQNLAYTTGLLAISNVYNIYQMHDLDPQKRAMNDKDIKDSLDFFQITMGHFNFWFKKAFEKNELDILKYNENFGMSLLGYAKSLHLPDSFIEKMLFEYLISKYKDVDISEYNETVNKFKREIGVCHNRSDPSSITFRTPVGWNDVEFNDDTIIIPFKDSSGKYVEAYCFDMEELVESLKNGDVNNNFSTVRFTDEELAYIVQFLVERGKLSRWSYIRG
jgi:hypothetical protein